MNINFPPVDDQFIKNQIESGYYSNATELVRDAVRRLREEEEKRKAFLAAVKKGEDDIAAGRTIPYSEEWLEEVTERAIQKALNGEPPKSDVVP